MSTLVNVTVVQANVTANSTTSNITVAQSNTVVTVSNIAVVSNSQIRQGISVSNVSGFGNIAFDSSATSNGIIQYTGTSQTDIRGSISNTAPILYNSSTGVISANVDAIFSNTLANVWFTTQTTDNLTEGSSNLYFTAARSRGNISVTDSGGDGSLSYDSGTGVITYTGPSAAEVRSHISATANIDYDSSTGVISESLKTQDITEGDSLYFTAARARGNISVGTPASASSGGALAYNDTTGVFTFTPADINPLTNAQVQTFIEANGLDASANITTTANTSAAHGTFTGATSLTATGNVSVGGNLNVTGNINSETVVDLFVEDRNITLQYGSVGAPSANSQIFVDRGSSANTYILWDEGDDKFKFSNDGSTDYAIPVSTSDLAEGTNLYFTAARARGNISATGNINYDNSTGIISESLTTTDITEGDNLYFTPARSRGNISVTDAGGLGSAAYDSGTGVITYTGPADSDVRGLVSVTDAGGDGSLAYNSGTGVITYTGPSASEARAHISATANILYNSSTGVISEDLKTQDITEGDNLYFTAARSRGNISVTQASASGTGALAYDSGTGVITYTPPVLPVGDITGVTAGVGLSGGGTSGTVTVNLDPTITTASASSGGSLAYDNSSGVFTFAPADIQTDAEVRGLLSTTTASASGGGSLAYDNGSGVFTFAPADSVTTATNATNSTNATNVGITDDTSTGATHYVTYSAASSGNNPLKTSSSKLFFNPGTGDLTVGGAVTASSQLNTSVINPLSADTITFTDTNDLKLGAKKSSVSYVTGNIHQTGTYIDRPTAGGGLSDGRVLTTSSEFSTAVGSTQISGMVATNSNNWPNGLGGLGGTATYVEGSPDVVVTGLQTLDTVGAPGYIFGGRTTEDPANKFQPGMQIITALSQAHQTGAMPKNAYALSLNSSDAGGNANIRMSANATFSKVYTISAVADQIGLFNTVENPTTGDRRALHGVAANFGITGNDFVGMATTDHPVEGTSQLGANYFEHFSNTSLPTTINANVTPSMITTANVASTAIQDIIDMKAPNGYYRFPDSVLVGDQSINTSRNNYLDSVPGFGLNIQWSGNGDTAKYGSTAQTAMTFQAFTDNSLQSSSGFEDKAGPRIMLSSFTGNKNDAWQGWYPRTGQELGKYAWWSTTGESSNPSTTVPPAAITAIAGNDWDTNANTSVDVIHYASSVTSGGAKLAFLTNQDSETSIGSYASKKIKFGESGTINTDVRANAALVAEWANIGSAGISTGGIVTATGNVSGGNLTTTGAVQGDNTVLKKFNETKVDLGSVNGDQSSALNATNGSIYTLVATGGITINSIANAVAGTSMTIIIRQDGTGSRTLSSTMLFSGGSKTLSTAPNSYDIISVIFDGTTYYASLTKAYA